MGGRKDSAPFYPAHQSMDGQENAVRAAVMQAFKRWLCQNLSEEIGEEKEEKHIFTQAHNSLRHRTKNEKKKCLEVTAM